MNMRMPMFSLCNLAFHLDSHFNISDIIHAFLLALYEAGNEFILMPV